jgi:hypothetical protein
MARLNADETERYAREGWVVPRWRLPHARVQAMTHALDELLRRNPGVRPEKLVSAHVEDSGGGASPRSSSSRATARSSNSSPTSSATM